MIKLAVIGDPIGHSLSPIVHGAILDQIRVPYEYQKIEVKRGALSQFLKYAKKEALTGFNLTMPHKKDILPYLDEIETEAQRFRAVNTVYQKDGRLLGYNTDAVGYTAALAATGRTFSDKNVVILGAGGVAGTLLKKAAYDGAASVTVLNRTLSQAEQLCRDAEKETGRAAVPLSMTCDNLERACRTCDILIQATPLGMQGVKEDYTDFSFLDALPPDAEALNEALVRLAARLPEQPEVRITYFQPDARKSGGIYRTISARVRRLDADAQVLLLTDGTRIPFDALLSINSL